MPITDDRTPNLNLPLPYADNLLEDDSTRLRDSLGMIDTAVAAKASAASVTALAGTVATKADLVGGKVPAGQLPAFVDDVIEVANFAALPATGDAGVIYVTLATNKTYRWSGSAYIEIASSPGSTDVVPEGATNLYHTPARALAAVPIATTGTLGKVKVGAGLGIDGDGLLYAAAGGGSIMSLQEVVPPSNGVSSITVPSGYVVGTVLVGYNGSFLSPNDFTATDGTTIGLVGFTAGTTDSFVVVKLATVVIGTLPTGSVGTTQLADGSVTLAKLAAAIYGTSGANKLLQLDGAGKLPSVDGSQLTNINAVPVGAIIHFPYVATPSGFLKANGAAISRTVYAGLFAVIGTGYGAGNGSTTFNVPDLRGEFIRGWDDGRGVDSGRGIGTNQSGDNASHTHTVNDPSHAHTYTAPAGAGYGQAGGGASAAVPGTATSSATTGITIASSGSEARPRNVALMACIKY